MIDSHQHFWKYDPDAHSWITDDMRVIRRDFHPPDLKPLLGKNGFEGCVVVQVDQTEAETQHLSALAKQYPFIRGVVGWIDLRSKTLRSRLEYFSSDPIVKGFRHIVQGEAPGFLKQPSFVEGVALLREFGFTYDLLIYHHQLEEAIGFVRQLPDVPIVVDHIAKPAIAESEITEWKKGIATLASFSNVFCKISGMVTEAKWPGWKYDDFVPYMDVIMERFGAGRVMYGSDWPVCLVAASYDEQLSIVRNYTKDFSPSEKAAIFGDNAKRFYNL